MTSDHREPWRATTGSIVHAIVGFIQYCIPFSQHWNTFESSNEGVSTWLLIEAINFYMALACEKHHRITCFIEILPTASENVNILLADGIYNNDD